MPWPGQDSPVFVFLREPGLKASFLLRENSKRLASLLNFKMVSFFVCVHVCTHTHTHIGGGQKTTMWGPGR